MELKAANPSPLLGDNPSDPAQAAGSGRERFSGRVAFYLAAIGSAVGFGNVWRFPSLVYEYGGGAFFVPYLLALALVGIPILVLEVSLGQYYEAGDVGVFGSINKRLRGVGLASIACGYMLVTYYSMLLAWTFHAFFDSFGSNNFWDQDEVTGSEAKEYFYGSIVGMSTLGPNLLPTRLVGANWAYSLLTWVVVFLSVAWGLEWTGKITYFTMGFPVLLLFVFLGRAVTLEGSQDGIAEYIGDSNWSVLTDRPEVWSKAVSQIFFSLGVTFGVMTAYGSHCKRDEPAFLNSCVVAVSNSLFSFISGFAVFATLGHLVYLEGHDSVSDLEYSSFGLVFGSWPVALGTMAWGAIWIRLFFVMLFLLGIDSAFSFMESFLTVLYDCKGLENVDRKRASLVLAASAFLFSSAYATDAGLIFLDAIDYYINFVIILIGFLKCFAAGWLYKVERQIESLGDCGAAIVFAHMATTFGSLLAACAFWFGLRDVAAGFATLIFLYTIGMVAVSYLMNESRKADPGLTWRGMYYDLLMKNAEDLRSDLGGAVGYLPRAWSFLIKHFIPPVLLVLFFLGASATTVDDEGEEVKTFGHYRGYAARPYQVLGVLTVVFAGFLSVSSMVFPKWYDAFEKADEELSEISIGTEHETDLIEMKPAQKKGGDPEAKSMGNKEVAPEGHLA